MLEEMISMIKSNPYHSINLLLVFKSLSKSNYVFNKQNNYSTGGTYGKKVIPERWFFLTYKFWYNYKWNPNECETVAEELFKKEVEVIHNGWFKKKKL